MQENYELIDFIDFGDTRNPKCSFEKKYNKHNKGKKELERINYIKMKREEQSLNDKNNLIKNIEFISYKKSKKRILQKISINDKNYENNTQHLIKKIKKSKNSKKDRIRSKLIFVFICILYKYILIIIDILENNKNENYKAYTNRKINYINNVDML